MSEALRPEPDLAPAGDDREARIEHLLLSGLDHYFGARYQQAINVWTRVVFLERGHSRARAYIDRARGALAERQRASEELVHDGIAAYNAGDISGARDLLTRAVEEGGPSDTALLFLARLSRVLPVSGHESEAGAADTHVAAVRVPARGRALVTEWMPTIGASALAASCVLVAVLAAVSWFTEPESSPALPAPRADADLLPIVRPSDVAIERAEELYAEGHLRDALRLLERVDSGDPARPAAERLRGDIQRVLFGALVATDPPGAEATP